MSYLLPDGRYDRAFIMSAISAAASADRARTGCSWGHAFRYHSHQFWFAARCERADFVARLIAPTLNERLTMAHCRAEMWSEDARGRAQASARIDLITRAQRTRAVATMKERWT